MSTSEAAACLQRGDLVGAEAAVTRALRSNSSDIEALNMRVILRHQHGDLPGAIEAINAVLALTPNDASAHFNRATLLHQAGRLEEAVHGYARALQLEPRDAAGWVQRAAAEGMLGRLDDVVRSCDAALAIDPANALALNEGATALAKLGRLEEALALFDRLIAATPDSAPAHTNRGKVLAELLRFEEACKAYKQAIGANPMHAPAWNNLGVARAALGLYDEAIEAFESASLGEGQNFDAGHPVFNKSTALLVQGQYEKGFELYRQRFVAKATPSPPKVESAPVWNGEPIEGLLRIRAEQGVGDQLLFTRLLGHVLERTRRVAVDSDPRISALLSRAYPQLERVLTTTEICEDAAAHIAMGDIPHVLKLTAGDIQAAPIVMQANAARTQELRSKYRALDAGRPVVGIAWASPRAKLARSKGVSIEHWGPLLRQPYVFVSLQYGDADADIEAARKAFGAEIYRDESIDQMRSMDDFAAQLSALDRIVTVSNTTAHMAGALGLAALVLVPPTHGLHWYWGSSGSATPWYPRLTIVRRSREESPEDQVTKAARILVDAFLR